jgi:hypothetical protein
MSERMLCQVCGRPLVPLKDGTSRQHTPHRAGTGGGEYYRCPGSGYRMARWPVGQRLIHHTGMVWEVIEARVGHRRDRRWLFGGWGHAPRYYMCTRCWRWFR